VGLFYGITFDFMLFKTQKMKFLKIIVLLLIGLVVSQCVTVRKLQDLSSFEIGEAFYKEDQSGISLYIPVKAYPKHIVMDSVYFHGKQTKLEVKNGEILIGQFKPVFIQKPDIIMSNEPYAEYGNQIPKLPKKIPFKLKEDECIISYKKNSTVKYFKISGIIKK